MESPTLREKPEGENEKKKKKKTKKKRSRGESGGDAIYWCQWEGIRVSAETDAGLEHIKDGSRWGTWFIGPASDADHPRRLEHAAWESFGRLYPKVSHMDAKQRIQLDKVRFLTAYSASYRAYIGSGRQGTHNVARYWTEKTVPAKKEVIVVDDKDEADDDDDIEVEAVQDDDDDEERNLFSNVAIGSGR